MKECDKLNGHTNNKIHMIYMSSNNIESKLERVKCFYVP
jgi:hypothetical protein